MRLGVFDSGIGGLTVVRHLRRLLPSWEIVYFGDTARVPYGTKSDSTVRRFASEAVRFLAQFRVRRIVVACNTVSAVALRHLEREFQGLPVTGVILPGAAQAVRATRSGRIGVIGTRATVASKAYQHAIAAASKRAGVRTRVWAAACPLLVPLAEEGLQNSKAAREVLKVYLAPLARRRIDTLILGCTHYPPFKRAIRAVLGPRVRLIDSGEATARKLAAEVRAEAR
ncbi:MAG: glutamate racemase, partial [Bacteroidota bacterium]